MCMHVCGRACAWACIHVYVQVEMCVSACMHVHAWVWTYMFVHVLLDPGQPPRWSRQGHDLFPPHSAPLHPGLFPPCPGSGPLRPGGSTGRVGGPRAQSCWWVTGPGALQSRWAAKTPRCRRGTCPQPLSSSPAPPRGLPLARRETARARGCLTNAFIRYQVQLVTRRAGVGASEGGRGGGPAWRWLSAGRGGWTGSGWCGPGCCTRCTS